MKRKRIKEDYLAGLWEADGHITISGGRAEFCVTTHEKNLRLLKVVLFNH